MILVMNCGSSTLKCEVLSLSDGNARSAQMTRLAEAHVDRIGGNAVVEIRGPGTSRRESTELRDHAEASRLVLNELTASGLLDIEKLTAVGHRVIHGGHKFSEPAIINDRVIAEIRSLVELAPLHNGPALQAIMAVRKLTGDATPSVAVFDTAFHSTLPEHAWRYAIDHELADRHGIRRYGFHGLAHRYMVERYCALKSRPPANARLITMQLGNGCSAAAIMNGKSVDTSMGFTPLEGMVMGTRSGDIDPSLVTFIAEKERTSEKTVEEWLNRKSGLLGVSGRSKDMRELLAAEHAQDRWAALAIEVFTYRVKKYIGSYLAVLGGAEAIVFGGGIGENSPEIRKRVCSGMDWCGILLDERRNSEAVSGEASIGSDKARVGVFVVKVDEASVIAREVLKCLGIFDRRQTDEWRSK